MSPSRIRIVKRTPLRRVSVIGLGLMGGSLALALRRAGLASHIVGCGRQVLVERAMEMSAIDSDARIVRGRIGGRLCFSLHPGGNQHRADEADCAASARRRGGYRRGQH